MFTDGCIGACVKHALKPSESYNDMAHSASYRAAHGTIARQEGGRGLFAKYDR